MDQGALLGLPLAVVLAFVALLLGLGLVAVVLHGLHRPAAVRRTVSGGASRSGRRHR